MRRAATSIALVVLGAALALGAGCASSRPAASTREPEPEALLLLAEGPSTQYGHFVLQRVSLDGGVETVTASTDIYDARVSKDGGRFLYSVAEGKTGRTLREREDATGRERIVTTEVVTFGYAGDEIVAITGKDAPIFRWDRRPTGLKLHIWSKDASETIDVTSSVLVPTFVSGDEDSIYFFDESAGRFGGGQRIWRLERDTRRFEMLLELGSPPHHSGAGHTWMSVMQASWLHGKMAASEGLVALRVGFVRATKQPGGYYGRTESISVRRMTDMQEVRSIPATPLYEWDQERDTWVVPHQVLGDRLDRYLERVETGGREAAIVEVDAEGRSTVLTEVACVPSRTDVLGYVGDDGDFAYYATRGDSTEVFLFERRTRSARSLGRIVARGPTALALAGVVYR